MGNEHGERQAYLQDLLHVDTLDLCVFDTRILGAWNII